MTFDHELTLIGFEDGENAMGDPIKVPVRRTVLCDMLSVTRSEHYQAAVHGLNPEIVFVVNRHEYQGEQSTEFEGTRYKILRTYQAKKAKDMSGFEGMELICEKAVIHDGDA